VYIVIGFCVVVILLAMAVLFPLLYRKYVEKSRKGHLYTSYSHLRSESLSQVLKLISKQTEEPRQVIQPTFSEQV
jgi:hypothetical protein